MKKMMIAAVALTMLGGAAFAQKGSRKVSPASKQEVKQENNKTGKHAMHKKTHDKKAAADKKSETVK